MADLVRLGARGPRRALAHQGPVREFLVLRIGADDYGVELTSIREILSPPPVTFVPRAPRSVLGVCSVRGLLVTVVDLRARLGLEAASASRRARLLLTGASSGEVFGVLVDEVRQVVRLSDGELELASTVFGGDVAEHVLGIGRPKPGDDVIILLDLVRLVDHLPETV
ncbi:MAG: chemotaxis protein CheW [Polyangiaceae bacterium]|nr:chemotaxis protein CheW [Polyangiaceae bacterium]